MDGSKNYKDEVPKPVTAIEEFTLDADPLLKVQEVANYLRIQPATVRALAKVVKLRALKVGREWRFHVSSLNAILAEDKDAIKRTSK